ncbi:MAG: HD domain-containing phosphohydrolase [Thermodesulfobacteriota bacterium]|nr:HD domain-containing phosphohydrolase [Thermodesulfobacteriota bacterium]
MELTNKQNKRLNELNKDLEKKVEKRTGEIIQKNKELEEVNKRLENSFMDAIRLLSSLVESLNPDLGRHMRQVAKISREIAEEYGLDRQAVDQIEIAGRLHDIGLLGLPETILEKHEKEMNAEELEVFRPHPTIGQICLQPLENLDQVAAIILSHHEHYNGSGFPNGLKGEDIPLGARIICAVSDYCKIVRTWPRGVKEIMEKAERYIGPSARDILVSERKIMIDEITRRIFLVGASKKYDPDVVQKLANKIGSFGMEGQPEKGQDEIVSVHVDELKVGMVLAMTLRTRDGRFVLGSGSVLNKTQVLGLQRLTTGEAIESQIYVLRNQGLAERS